MTNQALATAAGFGTAESKEKYDQKIGMLSCHERLSLLQEYYESYIIEQTKSILPLPDLLGGPHNPCKWTCMGCGDYLRQKIAWGQIEFYKRDGALICGNCYKKNKSMQELNQEIDLLHFKYDNDECMLCPYVYTDPDGKVSEATVFRMTNDNEFVAMCRNCNRYYKEEKTFDELVFDVKRGRGREIEIDDDECPGCGKQPMHKPTQMRGADWLSSQRVCKLCYNKLYLTMRNLGMETAPFTNCVLWLKAKSSDLNLCDICGIGKTQRTRCRKVGEQSLCFEHTMAMVIEPLER